MDIEGIAVGALVGIVIGALIFTGTGRTVSKAAAARAAYHIRPRNNR
jgi:uncharacterized protein YcfJ